MVSHNRVLEILFPYCTFLTALESWNTSSIFVFAMSTHGAISSLHLGKAPVSADEEEIKPAFTDRLLHVRDSAEGFTVRDSLWLLRREWHSCERASRRLAHLRWEVLEFAPGQELMTLQDLCCSRYRTLPCPLQAVFRIGSLWVLRGRLNSPAAKKWLLRTL